MRNILAAIANAVRNALSGMAGIWDWLGRRWDAVARSGFGRGCSAAWTALKPPAAAALDKIAAAGTAFDNGISRVGRGVGSAVLGVAKGIGGVGESVLGLPGALLRTVFGSPRGGQQSTDNVAEMAVERAVRDQAAAEAATELSGRVNAVRRVASALKRGVRPPEDAIARLPAEVVAYLLELDASDAARMVTARKEQIISLLESAPALQKHEPAPAPGPRPVSLVDRINARRASRPLTRADEILREHAAA